ncbi:hypothetical protein DYB32_007213 [Aphanomyces invadans]|uniref:FYVE-type domain-containing protein n=1 Tax=Aphanomyces invadans TaxID=157072 RepID=A0A418APE9_9STRA|nr:hypothetical protein DYB32_007213 [Aphanomyces invadans]
MKVKVPLPDGFFITPPLSENLRHEYIRQGQRSLIDFVEKTRLRGGPIQWTLDHTHHNVTVYRGKDMTLPSGHRTVYLNMTEVQATLDEAASIMSAGADGRRDYCATYHKDHVVDLKTLYPLAVPTPSHPHNSIAIKWRAVSINTPLIKLRDMVFMEKSLGMVRSHLWVGGDIFLDHRDRDGYLTVLRMYQQDAKGALKPWLVDRFAKHRMSQCMASLDRNFRRERVLAFLSTCLPQHDMIPTSARSHCALCMAKFNHIFRKSHCRKCGDVVCTKCNPLWDVDVHDPSCHDNDQTVPWQRRHPSAQRMVRMCIACTSLPSCRGLLHSMKTSRTATSDDEAVLSQDKRRGNSRNTPSSQSTTRRQQDRRHPVQTAPPPTGFQIKRSARAQSNGSDFPYVLTAADVGRRWQGPLESPRETSNASSASVILLHDLDDDASPGQLRRLLDHLKTLEVDRRDEPHDDDDTDKPIYLVDDADVGCQDCPGTTPEPIVWC